MNLLIEAIGGVLLRVIWWVALFPVVWLVCDTSGSCRRGFYSASLLARSQGAL
jgi:hypothetical protein